MSELTLPPDYVPQLPEAARMEANIVRLAREIAMDLRPLELILEHHLISQSEFEKLKSNPYFVRTLAAEREVWESAINTQQRVKIKSAAMLEEFLPVLYGRMVTPKEDLMKVVKGAELVTKLSGLGTEAAVDNDPASRVTITINMGEDHKLQVSKAVTPRVIDHEPADELQQGLFELEQQ